MSKKIWLITAVALLLVGCMIFGGAMTVLKWDFTKLSTAKFEQNEYEITEAFQAISVDTDTADIVFLPSQDESCSVICYEQKNGKHSVAVKGDSLVIELVDTRKWYEHIGIGFGTPKITVYLPQAEYGALSVRSDTGDVEIPKNFRFESIDISEHTGDVRCGASASGTVRIKTTTGSICVQGIFAGALDLAVSTGKVHMSDVACQDLISSGSTGDITLKQVIAEGCLSVKRSTGDVRLEASDAAEILIETDTGDVEGSLLTDKVFITKTDTGRVSVPKSVTGGRCEITTDTGDIKISIQQ